MGKYVDLTGKQFGRLTVLYRTEDHISKSGRQTVEYRCKCSCGKECNVIKPALVRGYTTSCGCLRSETAKKMFTKRDDVSRKLRLVYRGILSRCYDEADKRFERYGGRGIHICGEWLGDEGMENFIKWGRENGFAFGLSIDRINNDGDYSPSNCRWVDCRTQSNNRSTSRRITVDGTEKTVAEWCAYLDISRSLYKKSDQEIAEIIHNRLQSY